MRFMEKTHEGMMTITGKLSDGAVGPLRFAVSYYSRFLLILVFSFTLGWVLVIIDNRRDKLALVTNDERTPHGRSNKKEVGSCKALHADRVSSRTGQGSQDAEELRTGLLQKA